MMIDLNAVTFMQVFELTAYFVLSLIIIPVMAFLAISIIGWLFR